MLQWVFALCLLSVYLASVSADGDLLLHKNWHLLGRNGECGHRGALETPSESEEDADNEIPTRIFKGTDAIEHEFPWMAQLVSMLYKDGSEPTCGGTLINSRYVLTAAHCVIRYYRRISKLFVRLGAHRVVNDCSRGSCEDIQQVGVEEIIVHEHYSIEPVLEYDDYICKNDIALIRLKDDVGFINGLVTPVCLPADYEVVRPYFYGQEMVAAGFGQNNTVPEGNLPEVLQKISTRVLSRQECDMPLDWYGPQVQICVGSVSDQGVCRGDSGGPLMYWDARKSVYYQMGVASYIFRDCNTNDHPFKQDAIYTRVAHYMPWILDQIRE